MDKLKKMNESHSLVIDRLGGTGKVAKIFNVSSPTVSIWRKTKIPNSRMMYIELAFPDALKNVEETPHK